LSYTLNTVWYRTKDCSNLFLSMSARDFRQIEQDLQRVVSELKETKDSKVRRDLLLELRRLLVEADRLFHDIPE